MKQLSGLKNRYAATYKRLPTKEVLIGNVAIGANNAICLQSMTTSATENIEAVVQETLRLQEAGAGIVRITTQNAKTVESLAKIKSRLRQLGCEIPLVADVHFTPNAALLAAEIVEKVRINPGNFVDKKRIVLKKYDDKSFTEAKEKIAEKFFPLLEVCKKNNTSLRLGVNHGSLSDRIVHRYGDSPAGMVQSAYEYINLAKQQNFHRFVISMKSSNAIVMVHAYRLMALKMEEEEGGVCYPFHLGVTEAGDEEQGRVKSATGIASLLQDGIGDTVRVSLTEASENEIPVAKKIVENIQKRNMHSQFLFPPRQPARETSSSKIASTINDASEIKTNYLQPFPTTFKRRSTIATKYFGGNKTPKVYVGLEEKNLFNLTKMQFSALLASLGHNFINSVDKWHSRDVCVDGIFVYGSKPSAAFAEDANGLNNTGNFHSFPSTINIGVEESILKTKNTANKNIANKAGGTPLLSLLNNCRIKIVVGLKKFLEVEDCKNEEVMLKISYEEATTLASSSVLIEKAKAFSGRLSLQLRVDVKSNLVLHVRNAVLRLHEAELKLPILIEVPIDDISYNTTKSAAPTKEENQQQYLEKRLIALSTCIAPLFVDGLLDGVALTLPKNITANETNFINITEDLNTVFLTLQAARQRIVKPEYISCPSCGRTLFNLQTVTAKIKLRTAHLKGVKIGIMGCIVNGPGEMADAHFGYVGAGPGLITLYKGQEVVKKNIPEEKAVDELILLIKKNGMWQNP